MKNKKSKSTKTGVNRKKVPSDVSPSTSLPPLVEGQLRCFLRVTVSRVLWTITKPPQNPQIRIRWWGESSSGTLFRPRDGSLVAQKGIQSTARFPVRCGPKQFASYLTDMGTLVLDVVIKPDHLPVARAQITGLSRLSLSNSIGGFFTVVSPTSEKMGELQVALALEPLAESYDSSSSFPTPDMSLDAAPKTLPDQNVLLVPSRPRSLSGKESLASGTNTPRGVDHLYFPENSRGLLGHGQFGPEEGRPTGAPDRPLASAQNQQPNDLLTALLERGSKLREAMVMSSLRTQLDCEPVLKDTALPLPKDIRSASLPPLLPSSGKLFHELLSSGISLPQRPHSPTAPDIPECTADNENRAVELLLGSINGSLLDAWDGEGSPPPSLSAYSSLCLDSELNDPQYDESLLENLFYKAPISDSSDHDGELEDGGKSLRGKRERTKQGRVPEDQRVPEGRNVLAGLSLDQITTLGGMRLARVTVHSLAVPADSSVTTPQKMTGKGRPPRPVSSKRCSYSVEYVFPESPSSQTPPAEVTRVVSSKVTGGVVKFLQRTVFPVHFSGAALEQWWQTDLTLKIYSRKSSQMKPVLLGTAAFPLRPVLESEDLGHIISLPVQSVEGSAAKQGVGPLKVSIHLAVDSQDFTTKKKPSAGSKPTLSPHKPLSPHRPDPDPFSRPQSTALGAERDPPAPSQQQQGGRTSRRDASPAPIVTFAQGVQPAHPRSSPPRPGMRASSRGPAEVEEEENEVLLHALLMVPDGKDLSCGPSFQPPNVYLNCKLFGSDETARSVVSWGQTNPAFSFIQVAPVALTHRLLERMKNNMMVIEVWLKAGGQSEDRLLGLVKLPLHQFYMSFRDNKITHLLLQAQYPVVAVDSHMPIVDVFSGSVRGSLRVLLAMGMAQQIVSLQRMREEEMYPVTQVPRPSHLLDQIPQRDTKVSVGVAEALVEHVFVVRVEKVRGLAPLQSTVWGEADCYIQYSFPTQENEAKQQADPDIVESSVTLRPFRTATTLCVPDPVFGHSETHVLLAPPGVPVQKLLLSSLSSQGLRSGGGIQFDVWCRYYYPNVRDQHVARGLLLLPKLCGLVTMQRQQQTEAQLISMPLIPRTEGNTTHQPAPSGFLDVSLQYKHRPLRSAGSRGGAGAGRFVTLLVQIHRAAGLKAAARWLASADPSLRYFADAGVNAYVSLRLSFLSESERVCTRVVAGTFCPEFSHQVEVPCSLLVQREGAITRSLAELLQDAEAVFTVHNRDHRKGVCASRSKEAVLGTIRIPLADLIRKRTGIQGWFGLSLPQDMSPSQASHCSVGGLELSLSFAHHSDRDRMVKAARGIGWEPDHGDGDDDDGEDAADEDKGARARSVSVTVAVPRVWLPLHSLVLPGDSDLLRSTYCYFRYKLYDRDACCSDLRHPTLDKPAGVREEDYDDVNEDDEGQEEGVAMTTVAFERSSAVGLRWRQPLRWYLREERLEVQVWAAYGKGRGARPCNTDTLLGSAYVDLSALAKPSTQKQTISGVYPLFRRSSADLSGAAVRVHITMTPGPALPGYESDPQADEEEVQQQEEEEEEWEALATMTGTTTRQSHTHSHARVKTASSREPPGSPSPESREEDTFGVTITVDRAMHLSLKGCPLSEQRGGVPGYYVSYATTGPAGTVSTDVVQNSSCPVWDHHLECRLSKQLLLDPQQSLVFKVWHKGDVERVIGFATVDLSPLLSGFQSVCGWYNITDFSGQCQGQLKVAVAPLRGVHELRRHRQASAEDAAKDSSAVLSSLPLCYQTTGLYSAFPSHISRYPEQHINASPERLERLLSESRSSDRHEEHVDNVRQFHQSLQEGEQRGTAPQPGTAAGDSDPSRSVLFSALRKNLSELDDIQRYFSRKLTAPTFPSVSRREEEEEEEEGSSVPRQPQEERRHSDADAQQLLLKTSRLVGEVNSIFSGMSESHMHLSNLSGLPPRPQRELCPSVDQQSSTAGSRVVPPPSESPDSPPFSPRDCRTPEGDDPTMTSYNPAMTSYNPTMTLYDPTVARELPVEASEPQNGDRKPASLDDEEEELKRCFSEEEELEEQDEREEEKGEEEEEEEEEDDYDDEEFEETLLEPRTLNEVTSLTDRTSPWTSMVSDPDLCSVEELKERPSRDLPLMRSSLEDEEEEDNGDDEDRRDIRESTQMESALAYTSIKPHRLQDSDSEGSDAGSSGANDTLIETRVTPQRLEEEQDRMSSPQQQGDFSSGTEENTTPRGPGCRDTEGETSMMSASGECSTSPKRDLAGDIDNQQKEKLCDVMDFPNFFLPTQHLEASMRALRLAPIFPLATSDPETSQATGIPHRTRPKPKFTPSAANREETKRIAKIFASHFKDEH
ncbi:C2 domain-containing protein 3 [Alosa sapidissima]|uniref:C2 domain-containing protein 3 n=1 Tax=Alosa sapidissima TaxID=34773 RepID=UPI001C08878F|nr:C2 domain-containing protein 3 [Alosa sapidissima]